MKKELIDRIALDNHLGCYGDFNKEDPICKKYCALRLRCAIERDQNARIEILEDLVFSDGIYGKIH